MSCCASPGEILVIPSADADGGTETGGELLHRFDDVLGAFRERGGELGAKPPSSLPFVVQVDERDVPDVVAGLRERPDVRVACPNWTVSTSCPDGPAPGDAVGDIIRQAALFVDRHGLARAPGPVPVRVAVLDTGVHRQAVCCDVLAPSQLDVIDLGQLQGPVGDDNGHGSLVASIIHLSAPSTALVSIRCFDDDGRSTLASIVYAVLLARIQPEPIDVVNLSFSVDHSVELCPHCGHAVATTEDDRSLRGVFDYLRDTTADLPIAVAAAGNASTKVAAPAEFDGVVAVGAAGLGARPLAPDPAYSDVPAEFVFTHGGSRSDPIAIVGDRSLHGTSFATAVVSGRIAALLSTAPSGSPLSRRSPGRAAAVLSALQMEASRGFPGYDPAFHGMGFVA